MSRKLEARRASLLACLLALILLIADVGASIDAGAEGHQLAPWIAYRKATIRTAAGTATVDYLVVEDFQEHYRLEAAIPASGIGTLATVGELVRERGAIAGIDANFFDPDTGLPIGLIIHEGRVLNTPYGQRAVLGVDLFGHVEIFTAQVGLSLRTPHGELDLAGVNTPPSGPGIYFYTKEYVAPLRPPPGSLLLEVRGGQVRGRFTGTQLASEAELLLGVGEGAIAQLGRLTPGDRVIVDYRITPPLYLPLREAISAGPLLLQDGEVAIDHRREGFDEGFIARRVARSAVGLTGSGELILMIAGQEGIGVTLPELAVFLQRLDVIEALALDGGGSAALAFREGLRLRELGKRRVAVGLVLVAR